MAMLPYHIQLTTGFRCTMRLRDKASNADTTR